MRSVPDGAMRSVPDGAMRSVPDGAMRSVPDGAMRWAIPLPAGSAGKGWAGVRVGGIPIGPEITGAGRAAGMAGPYNGCLDGSLPLHGAGCRGACCSRPSGWIGPVKRCCGDGGIG